MTASCPGFASYEVLPDGTVLVNGELPTLSASSADAKLIPQVWQKYGRLISSASAKHGVPASWLMGVLMTESRGNSRACSPCAACGPQHCATGAGLQCCAFGLMQMLASTANHYGVDPGTLIENPAVAIDAGARLLADLIGKFGFDLPRIAASYNSGGARCGKDGTTFGWKTDGDYPATVVRFANSSRGLAAPARSTAFTGFMIATAGLGLAYAIYNGKLL